MNPGARVVYVDIDPVAIAHARALLANLDGVEAILADLRQPESVLAHPLVRETLDLSAPITVLMNAVLHFIPDAEHPDQIVRAYTDRAVPGSYIAISHGTDNPAQRREVDTLVNDYKQSTGVPLITRDAEQLGSWLTGLNIQPPASSPSTNGTPTLRTCTSSPLYGLLARKPNTDPAGTEQ